MDDTQNQKMNICVEYANSISKSTLNKTVEI